MARGRLLTHGSRALRGLAALIVATIALGVADPAAATVHRGCSVDTEGVVEHGPRQGNRVALSFDEFIGPETRRILDALDRANAHATFFVVGEQAREHEPLVRRMVRDGHELGNHSFDHPDLTTLEPAQRRSQLRRTQRNAVRIAGFEPCLMRPPFGAVNEPVVADAQALGLGTVKWDIVGGEIYGFGSRDVAEGILDQVRPGSIVLMHQIEVTPKAVRLILAGLRERGLRSVPVVKLLGGQFTHPA